MNITYTWKITALKKAPELDGLSNVITHIRFDYTGTNVDTNDTYVFSGACPVEAPNPENFTEITSLTEEQVIEWAKANHPTDHMDEIITSALKKKLRPTLEDVTELSWLSAEEQTPEA